MHADAEQGQGFACRTRPTPSHRLEIGYEDSALRCHLQERPNTCSTTGFAYFIMTGASFEVRFISLLFHLFRLIE